MQIDSFEDLLYVQLQTLYNVETQLIASLPQLAQMATDKKIKQALLQHLEVTKGQAKRLENIGRDTDLDLTGVLDEGMMGILKEGQILFQQITNPQVRDAAILSGTQKVEQYEMAAYQSAFILSQKCGKDDIADVLQETFDEEEQTANQVQTMAENL